MKLSRPFVTLSFLAFLISLIVPCSSLLRGQSATVQATRPRSLAEMEAAGVKMSFDVASVRSNRSDEPQHTNVPFVAGLEASPSTGGLFSATNYGVGYYIFFAYDLGGVELEKLLPQLSNRSKNLTWGHRFDIQARAQGNPTLDQIRLMMQSLLADR